MTGSGEVVLDVHGGVAVVTLHAPDRRNALTPAMAAEMIVREAAGAMALFGEEVDRVRAAQLGLAWESVDDAPVEQRALELATRVAADPALARAAVGNFRREVVDGAVAWDIAMQYERPAQMWSMRRSADR